VAEEVETHHREPASLAPELVGEPVIRVLIAENQKQLRVAVAGPCRIVPNVGDPVFPDRLDESAVTPDDRSLGLKLGEHAFLGASELRFAPTGGAPIQLEGKPYEGELVVKLSPRGEGTLQAIDHVRAEQYVAGVIGGEMPLKWPDAALKAQSIAARTYAIWHWKNTPGLDHDVTADTRSQVYTGQATERARELVAATEGRVLTWQSRMFEAYFFAACSGETASAEWVFEGPAIEPLQGAKCGFCIASPHATWERKITQAELAKGLAGFGVKGRIERVETVTWPRGGYVREVRVHVEGGEVVSVPGPKFRFAFAPALKSAAFEVAADATGSVLVVTGHGWGHGVGLCQWGAKGCAETGMDEDQILARYYPGAAITKLY
jgi:stage II sporulation protein D